ncbi:MAG: VOC family protein [Acidobacteriia bacterium]|jgi:catechol 2,3-dioxygenase-like lactoylglutathione lyase family enzyme|nr:VOC family protein [Terriglobia bacterium]
MSLFAPAGSNYIGVVDIAAATIWYTQKLGLRKVDVELDDGEGCVPLGFEKGECAICLGPPGRPTDELTHMLYSSSLKKAREFLMSRGVNVGDIQQDRQGTHYFEMRDLEGNVIEITEEI